jgi:hypothetical protein
LFDAKVDSSLDFQSSLPDVPMESVPPAVAIAELDTNAAQLWKH